MNKNKKTFKILLNSYVTSSFTGGQFNARYYVDLTDVISNDADFDKSYYVYVTFRYGVQQLLPINLKIPTHFI